MLDARDLPDGQRLTADICIVGAGAAGVTIAHELIGTGINVLLIESGDLRLDRDTQDLNVGSVVDPRLQSAPERYRRRQFGGSTMESDHGSLLSSEIDFETRSHVPNSGWPINAETMAPFRERALALCESDDSLRSHARDLDAAQKPLFPGFDNLNFSTTQPDRYGYPDHFGKRFGDRLRASGNVCVLLNATVTRLQMNQGGSAVETVMVRTLSGKSINIAATRFVLAAGALENARLLLANRDVHRNGIGNDTDNVGRFLLCPIQGSINGLALNPSPAAIWYGSARSEAGIRGRRRITLKPESQRRLQVGNFVARLRPEKPATTHRLPSLLSRKIGERGALERYTLDFQSEQQPQPSSRITLGDARDALGMPRLVLDWNSGVADFETVRRSIGLLAEDLARAGVGTLTCDAARLASMMTSHGPHGGNHQGTTRMGSDARTSVVDANCRIHDTGNLFVAGASVFPTSSLGDPMLALVALSLRLADHLKLLELRVTVPERLQSRLAELKPPPVRLVTAADRERPPQARRTR